MPSETHVIIRFVKLTEHALSPIKGSAKAAGYDLRSAYDLIVPARGKELVRTDIQIELPAGCYGRVAPRSGLALKHHIDVGAGVIDEDYRGNVGVLLFNHSDQPFEVKRGDRIAQLICQRIFYPDILEVEIYSDILRLNSQHPIYFEPTPSLESTSIDPHQWAYKLRVRLILSSFLVMRRSGLEYRLDVLRIHQAMDDKPITPSKKSFSALVEEEMLNFAQNTCNIAKNKSSGNREQEALLAFELLEQHTANSSFCSTSSLVTKLLDTAVKSTPKKELQNIYVHRKSEKRDVSSQCVTNHQELTKNQLPNRTPSFSELAGNWRYAIKPSSQPLTSNQNNTGTNCDRKNKELEYENKISMQSDLPDRIGLGERIVSALKGLENSVSNKPTVNTNLKSGSNDHKQLHVHFAEKEQILNGNDDSTVTSSTYSEVAEVSPTVNAESKFQDDSEWSDCEWNSDLNSSGSVNEDQQEMHYPVSEKHSEHSDLQVQKPHNENSNQDFSNQKKLHAHGIQEHDKNILEKTETLRARLQELENEIEIFKKENHTLTKLRKEHEENIQTFLKEKKKYENQMKENEEKLRGTIDEEKRKLAKERMVFEKYCKNIKNRPSKQEREEIQALRQQVAELQEELNKKNSRWSANQVRTTERLKQMGAENSRLKQELETLTKEKEKNNKLTKQSKPKQVQKNSSEGSFMETIFDNGDIEQKFEDKNLVKYYYASTSTWQTTEADGTEVFEFPNGQIERHYKDNSKEVTFPDGSVKLVHSKGQEEWKLPDRTLLTIGALGEKRREYPDGTVKIVFPDGRQETHYPNGRLRIKDAKGNLILDLIETNTIQQLIFMLGLVAQTRASFQLVRDVGYYKYHTNKATWQEAQDTCRREDSNLVLVNTPQEMAAIGEIMHRHGVRYVYSGFHDLFLHGQFDYEFFPGVGYYKLFTSGENWVGAHKRCTLDGAHLAVINSETEAGVFRQLLARFPTLNNTDHDHRALREGPVRGGV
uniref:C-type lectin domain-containing protein n=1 Tax=Timema monikensis TaxID=170555 RepID=A0A7R9E0Q9_9NEOP|nr:unnamed protein product [Timema monikensis]